MPQRPRRTVSTKKQTNACPDNAKSPQPLSTAITDYPVLASLRKNVFLEAAISRACMRSKQAWCEIRCAVRETQGRAIHTPTRPNISFPLVILKAQQPTLQSMSLGSRPLSSLSMEPFTAPRVYAKSTLVRCLIMVASY